MRARREFLKTLGLGFLAAISDTRVSAGSSMGEPPAERHWTWTRVKAGETPDELHRRFAAIRAAGVSALILGGADAEVCALAAAEDLDVHAWWWALCRRDESLMRDHPDWYVVSRDGRSTHDDPPYVPYYRFLCPTRPEVRRYLRDRLAETLAIDGLAGVCLDYIRFPDVILPRALWEKYDLVQHEELPRFDFCYCKVCREAFRALEGVDPLELPDPPADPAWRRFRWDAVTRLVNELAEVARGHRRMISASVFPSPSIARRLVRQDWAAWDLDAVMPMVYHSFYDEPVSWIEGVVADGVKALPVGRPLYPALYLPKLKDEGEFEEAVARARAGGAAGIGLFGGVKGIPAP